MTQDALRWSKGRGPWALCPCRAGFALASALLLMCVSACSAGGSPTIITPGGGGGSAGAPGTSSSLAASASDFATASVCSSDAHWTRGDRESPLMHPGGTCISCHSSGEGPAFSIAGTVYPTGHEPNDCNGVDGAGDVQVVITDAAGSVLTLDVNAAGNFSSNSRIAMPFHAKVVTMGQERAMAAAQTTGDCNGCHTEGGANGAPGRIMLP